MRKIYLKLFVVVAVAAAVISILMLALAFTRFQERRLRQWTPRESRMVQFLIREIDTDPTVDTVERLARNYSLRIQVRGPRFSHSTDAAYFQSPEFQRLKRAERHPQANRFRNPRPARFRVLLDRREPVGFEVERGPVQYVFVRKVDSDRLQRVAVVVTLLVLATLGVLAFLVKRWLADPLSRLETAIREFPSQGADTARLPASGDMRRLFDAFNDMRKQVQQTLADKERLLRDVSHDLKSPITRMRVAVEMLPKSPQRERILQDLTELTGLVDQILEVQGRDPGAREEIRLGEFMRDYLRTHPPGIPVNLEVESEFTIQGSRAHLTRVVENILDNSRKYADRKRGVDICVSMAGEDGLVTIQDYGSHVTREVTARMFEPFYQADEARRQDVPRGSGLGLAICRNLVQGMGGDIEGRPQASGLLMILRFPLHP